MQNQRLLAKKYEKIFDKKYSEDLDCFIKNEDFKNYNDYWETLLLGDSKGYFLKVYPLLFSLTRLSLNKF